MRGGEEGGTASYLGGCDVRQHMLQQLEAEAPSLVARGEKAL